MLQIEHKNLYNSWEAMLCEHLDDFKNDIVFFSNIFIRIFYNLLFKGRGNKRYTSQHSPQNACCSFLQFTKSYF